MKNIQQILIISVFFILLSFFNSCGKSKCFGSAGKIVKKERELDNFKQIELYGVFNVYLKSGNESKIEIEMGENLISNIETNVENEILTINDNNNCDFVKGYDDKNLYITVDTLTQLIVYDAAKLYTIDTLKTKDLYVIFKSDIGYCDLTIDCYVMKLSVWFGTGDYHLHGKADYLAVYPLYLSFIYAQDVESIECRAYNESMGDLYVNSNSLLIIKILDEGNIYYSGNPSEIIVEDDSGSGSLIKMDK